MESLTLAEGITLAGEFVGDRLASRHILDGCGSGSRGGGVNGELDHVAGGEGDTGEVVAVVGVPLIPSIEAGLAVLEVEVDSSLQDRGLASVAINTNPGGCRVVCTFVTTRGKGRIGDSKGAGDTLVAATDEDRAGPVGAVGCGIFLGDAVYLSGPIGRDHGSGLAETGGALSELVGIASTAGSGAGSSHNGAGGEHSGGEGGGELHLV